MKVLAENKKGNRRLFYDEKGKKQDIPGRCDRCVGGSADGGSSSDGLRKQENGYRFEGRLYILAVYQCGYCLYPEKKHTIHLLAAMIGYTDYYFSTRFKKETGMSVRDYVMQAKINSAEMLLRETDSSMADIAARLGFGSQSHFGSVFRKMTGMTPTEYQEFNGLLSAQK